MNSQQRQVLAQARDLVARGWTRSAYARNKDREHAHNLSDSATCFCSVGAIGRAAGINLSNQFPELLDDHARLLGFENVGELMVWNDRFSRTQQEVVDRFDIALAEGGTSHVSAPILPLGGQ